VAFWRWIDQRCRDLNELRTFMITPDLERHVVRLHLDMTVSVAEESEVERILRDLEGTDATHGRAGVLLVDKANLKLQAGSAGIFPDDLPPALAMEADAVRRQRDAQGAILSLLPVGLGTREGEVTKAFKDSFRAIILEGADIRSTLDNQARVLQGVFDELKVPCWAPDPATALCQVG